MQLIILRFYAIVYTNIAMVTKVVTIVHYEKDKSY